MSDMTTATKAYGPNLYAYAEQLKDVSEYPSMRKWCEAVGLDDALMSRWKTSRGELEIDSMRQFGQALGLSLGQVLVLAGYGTPEDFGEGATPPPPPEAPEPPAIEAALTAAGMTNSGDREQVLDIVRAIIAARDRATSQVRSTRKRRE